MYENFILLSIIYKSKKIRHFLRRCLFSCTFLGGAIMAKNKEKKNKKQGNNAEKHKPVNNETLNDQK